MPALAQQIGPFHKILIDTTNLYPQRDGAIAQQVVDCKTQTATEFVADQFSGAHIVKAFNSIYFKVLVEQAFQSGDDRVAVQVCGDAPFAK